jgi:hypothetical protein
MIHCHEKAQEIGKSLDLGEVYHGRQDMMLAFLRVQQEKEKEKGQEQGGASSGTKPAPNETGLPQEESTGGSTDWGERTPHEEDLAAAVTWLNRQQRYAEKKKDQKEEGKGTPLGEGAKGPRAPLFPDQQPIFPATWEPDKWPLGETRPLRREDAPTKEAETEKKGEEMVEKSSSSGGDTVGWATKGPSWWSATTLPDQIKFYRNEKRRMIEKHADTWNVERKWIEHSWKRRMRDFTGETHFSFETLARLADMEEAKEDEERRQQGESVLTYQFGGAEEKEDNDGDKEEDKEDKEDKENNEEKEEEEKEEEEKEDADEEGEMEIEETTSTSGYYTTMKLSDPPDQESRGIRVLTRGGQTEGS